MKRKANKIQGDIFKGFMKLNLAGVEDVQEILEKTKFDGNWKKRDCRIKIFSKPRKFKLKFYFGSHDGKVLHQCADFLTAGNDVELTHQIVSLGNKMISESDLPIDVEKSYVVVRA